MNSRVILLVNNTLESVQNHFVCVFNEVVDLFLNEFSRFSALNEVLDAAGRTSTAVLL